MFQDELTQGDTFLTDEPTSERLRDKVTLRTIAAKLARLREHGWQKYKQNFGVERHCFEMNLPIPASDLEEFESHHKVVLPPGYREFLLEIGNGGAGPYWGLLSLEFWHRIACDLPEQLPADYLARSCPLRPGIFAEDWLQELGCSWEERYQGSIALCHQGDGYYGILVVSGDYRGRIFYIDMDGGSPYCLRDTDFLSWYDRWLDESLSGKPIKAFGY
jgi:hypothetical protein